MTKEEIEGLSERGINEAVAEQVMGWVPIAGATIESTRVDGAWLVETARATKGQREAPVFEIVPDSKTPDFADDDWSVRIVARMAERGFSCEMDLVGKDASCTFAKGARGEAMKASTFSDAIRRAALLAVQE